MLEAVEGRLTPSRTRGVAVSVAGQALGGGAANAVEASPYRVGGGMDDEAAPTAGARSLTVAELLSGSSFALTGGTAEGGFGAVWGRGAVSRFDAREGELFLDGEVTSAMLGADYTLAGGTVGLMLAHSRGEGGYRGEGAGEVSSTLTGLYPYGRYQAGERVTLWGVAGYGAGTLTLTPAGQGPLKADMYVVMGAVGMRGVLLRAPDEGGLEVSAKPDALVVRTSSEEVAGLAGATADVLRLRMGLEATWRGLGTGGGATFVPTVEIGVRSDSGDAETGVGVDVGGGVAWSDPGSGLSGELRARGLLTHEAGGLGEFGIAGSLAFDPRPDSERGFSLTVSQTIGASASGGMDALLGRATLEGLAANDGGADLDNGLLELRMGYGFGVFGDRFTATPQAGFGLSDEHREYRLGWWLGLARSGPVSMELGLEATRREVANDGGESPEHGVMLSGALRW